MKSPEFQHLHRPLGKLLDATTFRLITAYSGSFSGLKLEDGDQMKHLRKHILRMAIMLIVGVPKIGWAQEEPLCIENSPERRGEVGCSFVEKKRHNAPRGYRHDTSPGVCSDRA